MIIMWLPILLPIAYYLMDRRATSSQEAATHPDVRYTSLAHADQHIEQDKAQSELTCREKMVQMWKAMPLPLPFYAVVCCKFLSLSVVTSLAFPSAPFTPRDHYQYYVFALLSGAFVGSSYGLVVSCFNCNLPTYTTHTWVFSLVGTACLLFLLFVSWFRFLESVWAVIIVSFGIGLCEGTVYNCTYESAARIARGTRHRKFARAFLTGAMGLAVLSPFLGLYIEPQLVSHCIATTTGPSSYCFTRSTDVLPNM